MIICDRMKVAMLGWEFPPLSLGGLGIYTKYLTKALSDKGIDIDFFMPKTRTKISREWLNIIQIPYSRYLSCRKTEGLYPYYGVKDELERMTLDLNKMSDSKLDRYNFLCAKEILKRYKKETYDLIHLQAWYGLKAGLIVKEKTNIPLVTTLHTSEYALRKGKKLHKKIIEIEKLSLELSDKVIIPSKKLKQILLKHYRIDKNKLEIVYDGVNTGLCEKVQKKKGSQVLFLGRLEPYKGCEFFLKAAKKVLEKNKNVKFMVVGWGKYLKSYVKLTKKLGIEKSVEFIGSVPHEKVSTFYSQSDVYVLPTVFDAFGITVLEAMKCGTPVIVSKTAGVSEVVKNCIKVDYRDVNKIARKILEVLENEKLRNSLIKKAKKEVEKFTWDKIAERIIKVYDSLT